MVKEPRTKVIKQPGSQIERVAQACDRCRLKKTRCDGKRPQCSQCASVGFECKISDKLSRRAFPRGYTETLEERVRELETENKRLLALLDLRDEQMELINKNTLSNIKPLSSTNLNLLNKNEVKKSILNDYIDHDPKSHPSQPGCCSNYPHSVSERPVSIAGSVDLDNGDLTDEESILSSIQNHDLSFNFNHTHNDVSFEQNQAPGLQAALAISKMKSNTINNKSHLATLVSMSIPRSTEETLFIPSLLSKIGQVHGYASKPIILTAQTIASLKEIPKNNSKQDNINLVNINFKNISKPESNLFFNNLKFPNKIQMDQLITIYFQDWNSFLPILEKIEFSKNYLEFSKSFELKFLDNLMFQKEKFGFILILILQLSLLSIKNNKSFENFMNIEEFKILIHYYDNLIHELINSSIAQQCCIQSLQILSLSLFYCLNIGDVVTAYALRGRVITMAQQLRLHRCPSAVLSSNGSIVSTKLQAERRILFWCIYSLDTFASLQLGVPRLLKDYEIECALPFSNDDENDENDINFIIVNNSKISLVGKVLNFSLAIMRFSKIMGNILDNIFKRHKYGLNGNDYESIYELILIHENLLDSWRRNLPNNLKFELDVNGLLSNNNNLIDVKKKTLITLYYSAKILIHLPLIANEVNNDEGIKYGSSNIAIQQCTIALLNNLSEFYSKDSYYLPIPINIIRLKIRLSLLSAKGSLEYTRGGSLFQESKNLLTKIVEELKLENLKFLNNMNDNNGYIPGNISIRCLKLLENAIESILSTPNDSKKIEKKKKKLPMASPLSQTTTDDEISQMLNSLDNIPPIVSDNHLSTQRIPKSSPLSQQMNDFDMNFNDLDLDLLNYNIPSLNDVELDFGADGSLGLASWLNDANKTKIKQEEANSLFDWQNST